MHEIIKAEIRKDLLSAPKIAVFISLLVLQFLIALIRFMPSPVQSFYKEIANIIDGKYSSQNEEFIEQQLQSAYNAQQKIIELDAQLVNNKITDSEYLTALTIYSDEAAKASKLEDIYSKYQQIKKSPDTKYMLCTDNWSKFLFREDIDYILVIAVLFCAVSIYEYDISSGMHSILITTSYGRNKLFAAKTVLCVCSCACLALMLGISEFAGYAAGNGLHGAVYPIRSLSLFSEYGKNITIIQAVILTIVVRLIGACQFGAICGLAFMFSKNTVITFFTGILTGVLPFWFFTGKTKYLFPLPSGLLTGTGMILPSYSRRTMGTDGEVIIPVTTELTTSEILTVVGIIILTIIVIISVQHKRYLKIGADQ